MCERRGSPGITRRFKGDADWPATTYAAVFSPREERGKEGGDTMIGVGHRLCPLREEKGKEGVAVHCFKRKKKNHLCSA